MWKRKTFTIDRLRNFTNRPTYHTNTSCYPINVLNTYPITKRMNGIRCNSKWDTINENRLTTIRSNWAFDANKTNCDTIKFIFMTKYISITGTEHTQAKNKGLTKQKNKYHSKNAVCCERNRQSHQCSMHSMHSAHIKYSKWKCTVSSNLNKVAEMNEYWNLSMVVCLEYIHHGNGLRTFPYFNSNNIIERQWSMHVRHKIARGWYIVAVCLLFNDTLNFRMTTLFDRSYN